MKVSPYRSLSRATLSQQYKAVSDSSDDPKIEINKIKLLSSLCYIDMQEYESYFWDDFEAGRVRTDWDTPKFKIRLF